VTRIPARRALVGIALALGLLLSGLAPAPSISTPSAAVPIAATPTNAAPIAAAPIAAPASTAASTAPITPSPATAYEDIPPHYTEPSTFGRWKGHFCHVKASGKWAYVCRYGKASGAYTIMLVGDSKMAQYATAFDAIARARGYRLLIATKSSCAFSDATNTQGGKPYTECASWNRSVNAAITDLKPDVLITSMSAASGMLPGESVATTDSMVDGLVSRWSRLEAQGVDVIALLNNSSPPQDIPSCVADNPVWTSACAFRRVPSPAAEAQVAAADRVKSVGVIDLAREICPNGTCPAVKNRILVYRQGSHLTDTFVRTLSPAIKAKFDYARQN
jgi:hypothetical protein